MDSTSLDHQVQLRALAAALERVCQVNCDLRSSSPTVFDAVAVPAMSIHCYLVRLHRYTKFDFVCFHVAAWYLGRLCREGSAYCPTMHNIHRLLIAALLVASKATDGTHTYPQSCPATATCCPSSVLPQLSQRPYLTSTTHCGADIFHANVFMAQCGGIGVGELNKLEIDLCERLSWKLLPTLAELRELVEALQSPQAGFWGPWYNAPRLVTVPANDSQGAVVVSRLPHARSVADKLGSLFRSSTGSEGNLQAFGGDDLQGASAAASSSTGGGKAGVAVGAADGEREDGSPRSVMPRTFSLSNLFGLASW